MIKPVISVIIPVYNVEKYIRQCVDSVLEQSYRDFELILVDDGSPDNSPAICDEYAQKDTRVSVIHQKNLGVSAARNNGIRHAKGEWITFVDSDDWVSSDYLEKFKVDEDDTDLIIQGLEYYDHRNGQYFRKIIINDCVIEGPDNQNVVSENNLLGSGYPVAKAFRRSIIDKGLFFDTSISYHEDHIFVLNAFAVASKIRLVNSTAYKYRYFHTNLSLSTKRHSWENLNIAAIGMINALNTIHDRFLGSGSLYERQIYNFAYGPKISAILEVFRTQLSDQEKRTAIAAIIDRKQMNKYYRPFSCKDRLVKWVLDCPLYIIQKQFFSIYVKRMSMKQ